MDQKFNTSFIPKKFLSEDVSGDSTSKYIKRRNIVGPGYFIAVLIFIVTVGASVGLFIYTRITVNSIENAVQKLKSDMAQIKSEDLEEFLELERKINNTKALLDSHMAFSEVLHKLEEKTLRDVQLIAFDYHMSEGAPALSLGAQTNSLPTVALQMQEFEKDRHIQKPQLMRLERDSKSNMVGFDMQISILPELVSYKTAITEGRHGKSPVPTLPTRPTIPTATSSPQ